MRLIPVSRLKFLNWFVYQKVKCLLSKYFEHFADKKRFKCPFNRCSRRFVELDMLKNHVLDHDPIYKREFKLFQLVRVIKDQGIYMIVYADRGRNSFFLRLCDECESNYSYQYVSAEKLSRFGNQKSMTLCPFKLTYESKGISWQSQTGDCNRM